VIVDGVSHMFTIPVQLIIFLFRKSYEVVEQGLNIEFSNVLLLLLNSFGVGVDSNNGVNDIHALDKHICYTHFFNEKVDFQKDVRPCFALDFDFYIAVVEYIIAQEEQYLVIRHIPYLLVDYFTGHYFQVVMDVRVHPLILVRLLFYLDGSVHR